VFCITYTLTCACITLPFLPVLMVGRLLGGVSTSILYSAFESWVVSSSNNLSLPQSDLSAILGRATLLNGFVATGAGVFSNSLVGFTHSFASPFIASGALLILGFFVISGLWTENYGAQETSSSDASSIFQLRRLSQAIHIVRKGKCGILHTPNGLTHTIVIDPQLLVIGLTQTCFEGSMYLFVFLWVPSLQEASKTGDSLPLGYIFSCFMVSMMLGSLLYTSVVSSQTSRTSNANSQDEMLMVNAKLSSLVCATSSLAFAAAITFQSEHTRFWAFCIFEACVGMYYPVQGMLRGTLVSNEHRATVSWILASFCLISLLIPYGQLSSLFRVPLNIFVVVSLLTGVSSARDKVLTASAIMLGISSIMTGEAYLLLFSLIYQ
jgi:MFS transporter, MFS domain-containing protein family, molybdate-anion transporter